MTIAMHTTAEGLSDARALGLPERNAQNTNSFRSFDGLDTARAGAEGLVYVLRLMYEG